MIKQSGLLKDLAKKAQNLTHHNSVIIYHHCNSVIIFCERFIIRHRYLTHLVQMGHRGRRVGRSCELGESGGKLQNVVSFIDIAHYCPLFVLLDIFKEAASLYS